VYFTCCFDCPYHVCERCYKVTLGADENATGNNKTEILKIKADKKEGKTYEVDKLLARWASGGEVRYLTKWKLYAATHATWEPGLSVNGVGPDSYEAMHRLVGV
jgi:hypothetical protein